MSYSIVYTGTPLPKETEVLFQGITDYAKHYGVQPKEPFAFFIRDENNVIKGGCNGNVGYNWLYIDQLWVDEPLRGKGYGTKLMQAAEALGREKNVLLRQ